MDMFGSTSPSYLILQSLDLCNKYLFDGYGDRLADCVGSVGRLKSALRANGCALRDTEPLKLVVDSRRMGLNGSDIADILREHLVECEYCDFDHAVLMFTPENPERDYIRIAEALCGLSRRSRIEEPETAVCGKAESAMTIRRAIFSKHETVSPEAAVGRVCGSPAVSCPPAVPIAVSGEIITADMAVLFRKYGISGIKVVCGQ
jgi:arginine/lysine/ornithine decarboxylase